MKLSLIGYYGFKNLGDDLMLLNLLGYLSEKPFISRINVFCKKNYFPQVKKVQYVELDTNSFTKYLRIMNCDYVIWGGGTCIYENTDNSGLSWISRIQSLAKMGLAKFCFLGIGIGNINTSHTKLLAKKILRKADYVCFRDEQSLERAVSELDYNNSSCIGGDLVFLDDVYFKSFRHCHHRERINNISFSGLNSLDNDSARFYAGELQVLANHYGAIIHFLPAHGGELTDNIFHYAVAEHMTDGSFKVHACEDVQDFLNILCNMDFHIGMRLHSVVCADIIGVPSLAVNYSPKVESYIKKAGILIDDRVVGIDQKISFDKIDRIYSDSTSIMEFIENEKRGARICIDRMFLL